MPELYSDSTEASLLDKDEFDPFPSSAFPSPSNFPDLPKFFTSHQLWGEVPEDAKVPTIECKKTVDTANHKAHSTFGNPKPKPSNLSGQPTPKPQPVH